MENQWKRKIQKPIGVYVLTTLIFIKYGVLNFIGYFSAIRAANGEVEFHIVAISIGLCLFTAGAAIWAFIGDNEGRVALLILLPLNVLWIILLAITSLTNEEETDDRLALAAIVQQVFHSLFVIGIEWYFMSKKVVQYYKQND